ncbi:MAG: PAC2 family protein, partial [Actinomycetota bacterium]
MSLFELLDDAPLTQPALVSGLNGWVDAGLAGTTAAAYLCQEGEVVVRFDVDQLVDYRARRPTLDIRNGVLDSMAWTELTIKRVHTERRDLLVFTGPEPDYKWQA